MEEELSLIPDIENFIIGKDFTRHVRRAKEGGKSGNFLIWRYVTHSLKIKNLSMQSLKAEAKGVKLIFSCVGEGT